MGTLAHGHFQLSQNLLILLFLAGVSPSESFATQHRRTTERPAVESFRASKGRVCISLAAHEEPAYIDALIRNFDHFTERTTRLSIHLSTETEYETEQLQKWEGAAGDRVTLTSERVKVRWFKGSILYAHLLNAKRFEERWPGACDSFLMQSSNMMWVRKGVETVVRSRPYAQLMEMNASAAWNHPFTRELYKGRHKLAWGQPEGAFFPMRMVIDFIAYMEQWLAKQGLDSSYIVQAPIYAEAFWLQYYALNIAEPIPADVDLAHANPPCFRKLEGNTGSDSIPLEDVRSVMQGLPPWDAYYAVKRVNRHMTHPTTQFILSLSS